MKKIKQWPIYYRILLMAVLLITLLSGALTLNAWGSMDSIVEQQLIARGAEIASHTAALSANYILVEDYSGLHELVEQATVNSADIRYVLVTDNKGRLLAHTFSRGIPKGLLDVNLRPIDKGFRSVTVASDEGSIHDILVPVENGEVGFVRVGMTEEFTRGVIVSRVRELGLVALLVCFMALFISAQVTALITQPISRLAQVAEAIKRGNLKLRASTVDGGEIGELAVAFNNMADSLIATNEEKELLLQELQAKEQLRNTLISKLLTAQEDERKSLSRELHDETSQALTSLMLTMRILAEDAEDEGQKEALLLGRDVAENILRDIRELAVELRPPVLDDLGLVAAIEKYLEKLRDRCGLRIELRAADRDSWQREPMDGQVAVALYRIVQESLSNVVKHSGASSVVVEMARNDLELRLRIIDDGRGLAAEDLIRAQQEKRLGIYGMQERAELLGGSFLIQAADGGGTEVAITIPIQTVRGETGRDESKTTDHAGG